LIDKRVVITGLGMISPVGLDADSSWKALTDGTSGVDRITAFDSEGYLTTIAAEVKDFDPSAILGKKLAKNLDRFSQFALVASLEAIKQSELQINSVNCKDIAVRIGSGVGGIITISEQMDTLNTKGPMKVSPFLVPKMLGDMAAAQVSMHLGIKGSSICTVSSCCSGGDAIGEAYELIRRGNALVAVAGGSEAAICPIAIAGFNSCKALSTKNSSPEHASRPFDLLRDGFVLGEGSGILIMETLENAIARGKTPLAEIIGYGSTSDAYHVTHPSPGGEGAIRSLNMALRNAKISPSQVDYVNAHGTSTPINDKFETMAMKEVFGSSVSKIHISSTKSMTGHLLGAAGAIESVVAIKSILSNTIPPTINLNNPDPDCDLDYTPHTLVKSKVSIVMSNSLGFGGHNTSLIFKQI